MKKILLMTMLTLFIFPALSFSQCDKTEARRLLNEIKEIYNLEYDDRSNILYVDMKSGWHTMDLDTKNKFLRAIANLDACVHGKARHIYINAWDDG